ncbi:membrane protein implicated in regulation of membrane protease activity [Nocardioides salarius]|uniref:Membrane protein implicated in regulation of membrane protease activity n=1 Tax=Nocardioides salarius TaxID=374513 RepID=A0ABS2MG36_9ACTN|nr:hypothetical protein [Nocardioides salarius]MBM7510151.1 membrane protein implicated in regulation of membrane protease activity [Nocardioides salarius]
MSELPLPSRTARLMVGVLTILVLLVGAFVLALVGFSALYAGAPGWVVATAVMAVLVGLVVWFQRLRRAGTRD